MKDYFNKVVDFHGENSWAGSTEPILPADGEGIIRRGKLKSFKIAKFAVTNLQFSLFVSDTNYISDAERFGWSFVFKGLISDLQKKNMLVTPLKQTGGGQLKGPTGRSLLGKMDLLVIRSIL